MKTMDCTEAKELLPVYMDGELDLSRALALEQHLDGCTACAADLRGQRALSKAVRAATYHRAPEILRARLRAQLPETAPPVSPVTALPGRRPRTAWMYALAASFVLATGLNIYWVQQQGQSRLEDELVSSHVRSLMANHLQDVVSSDHHTVKPWFTGKLDFSPPVNDLATQGFALTGGRLDYIGDQAVAALVYQHGRHTINLFIWPASADASTDPQLQQRKSYNLVHWAHRGMNFWAVSDMDAAELKVFAQMLLQQPV